MIDRTHKLPVVRQYQLLDLLRATAYYQPTPVSATELALMRRIDELHLNHPFAGPACCGTCSGERATGLGASEYGP
jgi:putative transposase